MAGNFPGFVICTIYFMKAPLRIILTILAAICIVAFLQFYTKLKEGKPNGFNRRMVVALSHAKRLSLGSSSFYLISLDTNKILLGNAARSGQVLAIPYSLSQVDTLTLNLPDSVRFAWGAAKIKTEGETTLLYEGITPKIFAFDKSTRHPKLMTSPSLGFDLLTPTDSGFGFRTMDTVAHKYIIGATTADGSTKYYKNILQGQQDGIFSTDGVLLFDNGCKRLIYVYYYRNGLLAFNQAMDTVLHGHTIDTISWARLSLHKIKSEKKITFSSPPLRVNKHACVWKGFLFVYSGLRADNEKGKLAFTSSVIDVYATEDLQYRGSFYVPNYDGQGIRDFAVCRDRLVALRGDDLFVFSITLQLFSADKF